MRPGAFTYKGLNSLTKFGIISRSVDRSLLPAMRPRLATIFGKHGAIDFGKNNYDTRQITMHIAFIGKNFIDLREKARKISAWLTSKQWERLIFDDEPDKYYLARIYDATALETLFRTGQTDIVFECQPFAYMLASTGDDPTWEEADFPWSIDLPWNMIQAYQFTASGAASFDFEHHGTKEVGMESPQGSKFDLIVQGSWSSLTMTLNGKTLNYTEAGSGTLVIDNVDMEVKLNGVNKLSAITGDIDSFLSVVPGKNTLQISGTGLNVTVTIDFSPMWI